MMALDQQRRLPGLTTTASESLVTDRRWRRYTAASFLIRFPQPMSLLGFQLIGLRLTGRLSDGAILVGVSSLCGVAGPLVGRWYDRGSTRERLQLTATVAALCLVGLALCGTFHGPYAFAVGLVVVEGVCLGASWAGFRSLMIRVVSDGQRTQAHYIESLMVEIGYAVGPLAVTAVAFLWNADAAIWAMVVSEVGGILALRGLPLAPSTAQHRAGLVPEVEAGHARLPRNVYLMSAMACASSFGFSLIESNVPARMAQFRLPASSAGLFMALLAGGSCLGGVAVSMRPGRRQPVLVRAMLLFGAFAILTLPSTLATSPWLFALALPINSLPLVPLNGLNASEIDHAVGGTSRGRAFGVMNAATRLGGGSGAMLNGLLLPVVAASRIPLASSADFVLVAAVLLVMLGASRVKRRNRPVRTA
jgi:MFS family permease